MSRMRGYSPEELERMALEVGYILKHCKGTHQILCIPFHRHEVCRPMAKRLVKKIEVMV